MVRELLDDFKTALAFLTRLPVRAVRNARAAPLARSVVMFPLVGALIGLAGALVFALSVRIGLTSFLAATLALAAQAWLCGALHEDGLADLADGLGGGRTREEKLEIMRDPRTGSFGVLALITAVLLRTGALATLARPDVVAGALLAAGALSRAPLAAAMRWLAPARRDGLAAAAGRPSAGRATGAAALALVIAFVALDPLPAGVAVLAAGLAGVFVGWIAQAQIGGITGDALGAMQQAAEVAVLLAAVATYGG